MDGDIMAITISQTPALIGIDRTPGKMDMHTELPKLELHQKQAKVNIQTELPKVQIDQYECFADEGLKNNLDLAKDCTQRAYAQAMNYIAKTSEDGDRLSKIELKGTPLADIAKRDAFPEKEFGYDYIPKSAPRITAIDGSVKIDPEPNGQGPTNGVEGTYIPGSISYNYTPTQIKFYMKQYNTISFKYESDAHEGSNIDTSV